MGFSRHRKVVILLACDRKCWRGRKHMMLTSRDQKTTVSVLLRKPEKTHLWLRNNLFLAAKLIRSGSRWKIIVLFWLRGHNNCIRSRCCMGMEAAAPSSDGWWRGAAPPSAARRRMRSRRIALLPRPAYPDLEQFLVWERKRGNDRGLSWELGPTLYEMRKMIISIFWFELPNFLIAWWMLVGLDHFPV